ncbi:MAG: glycosyltransferase family A protein [Candidatus Acidiferrum sp.]
MKITAIVCTYNRCQSLARALDSIAVSILSETIEWEVLVVNNNSSDETEAVVEDFCRRYPGRFRYLVEPQQGKSYALNAGIREARGNILAFVDDDVTVEPLWLQNLTSALGDTQWAGSGGRILPARGFVPPRWLALDGPCNLVGALCAYFDPGDVSSELKDPPFGANMAFRKEMFARYGPFRTDLGPFPNNKIGFEDTEFGRRLIAGGERLLYIPTAVVYHEVPEYRVRKEFLLTWWFDFGRGSVRETGKRLGTWETLKILGRTFLTALQWLLSFNSQLRFYRKCRIWYGAGKIVEVYQQTRSANSPGHKLERQAGEESSV